MKLTPLEIRKQEFRKTLRGFDPIEVQTFLEMVAEQYEQILEENKSTGRRIIELETKLHDYQENEKNLRETLLNVQEVKKQSEESSRRQADLLIKEAELKALEILEAARKQTRQIREEVNWLKSQKESFINRLRHILVSQMELLSVMEIDDILPKEAQEAFKALRGRRGTTARIPEASGVEAEEAGEPASMDTTTDAEEDQSTADRVIQQMNEGQSAEADAAGARKKPGKKDKELPDEDINDFFKKGIHIDDLIKTIDKKETGK